MPNDLLTTLMPGDIILTSHLGVSPIKVANFCKDGYKKRIWTHSALYLGNGQVVEAFPEGIQKRNLKEAYLDKREHGLKILRRKELSQEKTAAIMQFCSGATGGRYDKLATFVYFPLANLLPPSLSFLLTPGYLGNLLDAKGSYFCSELISEGFKRADAYCFEREPFQVMPVDFDNPLLFDEITVLPLPGKERQGKAAELGLKLCYVAASILLFLLFIAFLALCVAGAVVAFRWLFGKPKQAEPTHEATPAP